MYFVQRNRFYMMKKWWQTLQNQVESNPHTFDVLFLYCVLPVINKYYCGLFLSICVQQQNKKKTKNTRKRKEGEERKHRKR